MELYFGTTENGKTILLNEEETHHLLRVRRAVVGDRIDVTDGKGFFYRAKISNATKHACELEIESSEKKNKRNAAMHLVVAPTKNIDRIEWLIEKATEIGIEEISFIQCRRSERKDIRLDRMEKIALSAMKQSMKAFLPVIHPMKMFPDFLHHLEFSDAKYICTMDSTDHLQQLNQAGNNCMIMIGPEGDFHPDENALALSKGFKMASLGHERLRTETAALMSCMIFNLSNI